MTQSKTVNGSRANANPKAKATPKAGAVVKKAAPVASAVGVPPAKPSSRIPLAPVVPAEAAKAKPKLVRDSFTIPKAEYAVLDALKGRAARLMRPTKKSEILRAGIAALHAMSDAAFLEVVNGVPSLKTGRPRSIPQERVLAK